MSSAPQLKAKYLVIDSNVLIKNVRIERLASEFWTVPEVLTELRDKNARRLVETLPYELKTREPSTEAVKAVCEFARKIGEYSSLSRVDIKVLALTYMFDSEVNGTSHFKVDPQPVKEGTEEDDNETDDEKPTGDGAEKGADDKLGVATSGDDKGGEGDKDGEVNKDGEGDKDSEDDKDENSEDEESDSDSDGGEWITADNIQEIKAKHNQEYSSSEPVSVGCITSDFAMQNLILQIGMKLVSFEGLMIKKVQQYILRCFSCYKFCKQTEKKFCPVCGNNTMVKVAMTVNTDGSVSYYQTQRIRIRGTKYSAPIPKGGRKEQEFILTEDRLKEKTRYMPRESKEDVFSDEYSFGSRRSGPTHNVQVGYGNRNPNIARRKIGKKNRSISTR